MKNSSLCRYFGEVPAWQRQLEQLRRKSLAGYMDGFIRLEDASPDECLAAERLLGKHFVPPKLKYRMSDFEKALQKSRFSVRDLQDFWLQLDGRPLLSHARQKAGRQNAIERFFASEAKQPHGDAAANWLRSLPAEKGGGFQLLVKHMEHGPEAARWLHWVCCALDRLQQRTEPEELALCSCAVTTDPHALDLDAPAGRLLLHALSSWQDCEFPTQSRARLALLRRCGLMLDDISNFTAQRGLIFSRTPETGSTAEPARLDLALPGLARSDPTRPDQTQPGQVRSCLEDAPPKEGFCLLTLSQLEGLRVKSPTGEVYLLENQMVFSSLCHRLGIRQPMICTSGQFREASWRLLDLLQDSGCVFRYAGDFDPEGLGIADRLWQTYGDRVRFWHMTPEDYRLALSPRAVIDSTRLQQLKKIHCPALQPVAEAILEQKAAGYQEALIDQYFHDLCK